MYMHAVRVRILTSFIYNATQKSAGLKSVSNNAQSTCAKHEADGVSQTTTIETVVCTHSYRLVQSGLH